MAVGQCQYTPSQSPQGIRAYAERGVRAQHSNAGRGELVECREAAQLGGKVGGQCSLCARYKKSV